ncbi:speckle-type POZ protein B-like [Phymastichus coffea]|uniref:speckle-type POZ protein B-like n=1 Tax=Phymastichus coffea TaxID=108790 RepID=UPI00273B028E|nr:speckle-type POZ protein B-like [Phymastichus coffea]
MDSIMDSIRRTTEVIVAQKSFNWEIINFHLSGLATGECIRSPSFTVGPNDECKWHLNIYPRGTSLSADHIVSLDIILEELKLKTVEAQIFFFAENNSGQKIKLFQGIKTFTLYPMSAGTTHFMKRQDLHNYLKDNKLTIECQISVGLNTYMSTDSERAVINPSICQMNLSRDFHKLFDNPHLSDVSIVAVGKEFRAHKAILATRSPVFAALFAHDMEEAMQNRVYIKDINPDVLTEILRFIYTGKVENIDELAYELLSASDKYRLDDLKAMCEEIVCRNITVGNSIDILNLADLLQADILKSAAMNFIIEHAKYVLSTPLFKSLEQSSSPLVVEIYRAIAMKFAS